MIERGEDRGRIERVRQWKSGLKGHTVVDEKHITRPQRPILNPAVTHPSSHLWEDPAAASLSKATAAAAAAWRLTASQPQRWHNYIDQAAGRKTPSCSTQRSAKASEWQRAAVFFVWKCHIMPDKVACGNEGDRWMFTQDYKGLWPLLVVLSWVCF